MFLTRTIITKVLDKFFQLLDSQGKSFLSYSIFSIKPSRERNEIIALDYSDTAIIMQGQVNRKNKKFVWTLRNYLNNYRNVEVIVSTWQGEDEAEAKRQISKLSNEEKARVILVASVVPTNSGIANVNLQIVSTLEGLKIASGLNKKFVLKSRTDQGIFRHDAIQILRLNWSIHNKESQENERIVIGSRNTFLFRYFSYSDMLQYGTREALLRFWDTELDSRLINDNGNEEAATAREWSEKNLAEVFLVRGYLARMQIANNFTFESHLKALMKCFIVVDSETLGFLWSKYSYNYSPWRRNGFPYVTYEVSQNDWMNGNMFLEKSSEFEKYADQRWH